MQKINKSIEIVRSNVKGLSSMGGGSARAIMAVLDERYVDVTISVVNTVSDLEALVDRAPDLVFLGMKYVPGSLAGTKVWLSDFFDEHHITYTGSGESSYRLEANKHLAKKVVASAGLDTSLFNVVRRGSTFNTSSTLRFPLFVKPTNRGGGQGIDSDSVVHTPAQLDAKIAQIASLLGADALLEEYLPGREFSVAILKNDDNSLSAMPIELIAGPDKRGVRMLSQAIKSSNTEEALAVTDLPLRTKINDLALGVFAALGARDYGRIDIRLDQFGTPHFLEANLIPSLTSGYGSFPKACVLNADISYGPMILSIAKAGMNRADSVAVLA